MGKNRIRNAFSIFLSLALGGCGVGFDPNPKSASAPSVSPPATTPGCTTTLLARGTKNPASTQARGIYSDVRLIPGTSSPAIAYTDPGHLRFAYWNGAQYQIEAVAAEASVAAGYVRLAILSNGLPWIFWTNTTNVKAAVRSAPIGNPGTWTSGTIATGPAPRGLEVAVSPANQIGVAFLSDSATTGRPTFLYCDNGCTSLAGFSGTGQMYASNIVVSQTGMGLGWCNAGGGTYYPAATFGTSAPQLAYVVCAQPLSACLTTGSWAYQNAGVLTATLTKLLLDPTAVGDAPRVIAQNAAGLVTARMNGGCASVTSFGAGSTLGGAGTGTQWASFLLDPSGKAHVLANLGVAGVSYFNSSTTDVTAGWNAVGSVEAVTQLASHGGSAVLDPSSGVIYASYPQNITPYNLRLARIDYSTPSSGVLPHYGYPDWSGAVQLTAAAAQKKLVSAARTSAGRPAAAFVDYSTQSATNSSMQLAYRTGPGATDAWRITPVTVSISADFPSLAYDDKDLPWIAYFDNNFNKFYLARNTVADGTGPWTVYDFAIQPSGAAAGLPAASNTALAMTSLGGVTYPVMAVIDTNLTSKGVRAARLNPVNGAWTSSGTLGTLTATGAAHLAMDADKSGNLALVYQDLSSNQILLSMSASAGASWTAPIALTTVTLGGTGLSVRFNPVTGRPAVTYFDPMSNFVYYNACNSSLANCAASAANWSTTAIESAAGLGTLPSASGQLISTSLNFSATGAAQVTYPRGVIAADGNLMSSTNATGPFVSSVHASGAGGTHSSANPLNFGTAGWDVSTVINAAGGLTSVYLGAGNWIAATSCGD